MTGLMFPKPSQKKKTKKHGKSLLHQHDGTCYLCMARNGDKRYKPELHRHHVFGGPNRKWSEEDGEFVWLCPDHHLYSDKSAHRSKTVADFLHKEGQVAYEKTHSRKEFILRYGKNYL